MEYEKTFCSVGSSQFLAWCFGSRDLRDLSAYIAVGIGDAAWDDSPVSPSSGASQLTSELWRVKPCWSGSLDETMFDLNKILWADRSDVLRFVGEFNGTWLKRTFDQGTYVREYGLFINATASTGSGLLVALTHHSRIWWSNQMWLRREAVLDVRG